MSSDSQRPFGVRRQSEAATALWVPMVVIQSGVAFRFSPQSKERSNHEYLCRAV
jgi:hypothetical protein